jgi:hypothetical protein
VVRTKHPNRWEGPSLEMGRTPSSIMTGQAGREGHWLSCMTWGLRHN